MGLLRRLFGGKRRETTEEKDPVEVLRQEFELGVKSAQFGWSEYRKLAGAVPKASLADEIEDFAPTFRRILDQHLPFTSETIRETGREDHFWFILFTALHTGGTHPEEEVQTAFLTLRERGLIPRSSEAS